MRSNHLSYKPLSMGSTLRWQRLPILSRAIPIRSAEHTDDRTPVIPAKASP
ncbi:hypothetical protein LQ318_16940 [Aliifodinibius salicampi]|uniref:Uncharacterized protein n=1 Tax=Fodinibius salicampi TaxID=1920655 RepID=A0ABT3Q398_9BACT|nr:hypothetical protein [Fodinibius salicampi]MCW9714594.1 hypothetical protein [Fodinibius salicampi]